MNSTTISEDNIVILNLLQNLNKYLYLKNFKESTVNVTDIIHVWAK